MSGAANLGSRRLTLPDTAHPTTPIVANEGESAFS